jgi:hypothetical protein
LGGIWILVEGLIRLTPVFCCYIFGFLRQGFGTSYRLCSALVGCSSVLLIFPLLKSVFGFIGLVIFLIFHLHISIQLSSPSTSPSTPISSFMLYPSSSTAFTYPSPLLTSFSSALFTDFSYPIVLLKFSISIVPLPPSVS